VSDFIGWFKSYKRSLQGVISRWRFYIKSGLVTSLPVNICRLYISSFFFNTIKRRPLMVIALTEHIGDIVASEPVSYFIRQQQPNAYIVWVVNAGYSELLNGNININAVIKVTGLGEWIRLKKTLSSKIKLFDLHLDGKPCTKYNMLLDNPNPLGINIYNYYSFGNLLKVFSMVAGLNMPDISPKLHMSFAGVSPNIKLPLRYIVIHPSSNEETRNWNLQSWNDLIKNLLAEYPDVYIVEIGHKAVINNNSERYINYCGQLTLTGNAFIIANASYFIGIDSSFAHFANAYKINSSILIGYYRDFVNYMPYSGYFEETKKDTIIYHDAPLREMPFHTAFPIIRGRINSLLKS
jgi:heptosyltransferase III